VRAPLSDVIESANVDPRLKSSTKFFAFSELHLTAKITRTYLPRRVRIYVERLNGFYIMIILNDDLF